MWPWGVLGVLWVVAGIVLTNFSWDDDVDDFYGGLRPNFRYVFFAVMILFWPIWKTAFFIKSLRSRKRLEEE